MGMKFFVFFCLFFMERGLSMRSAEVFSLLLRGGCNWLRGGFPFSKAARGGGVKFSES